MGWTSLANPAYVTGHIMTQTDMAEITNNLRYLKGTDGAVTIDNALTATALAATKAGQATLDLADTVTGGTPAAGAHWRLFVDNVGGGGGNSTFGFYDVTNTRVAMGLDNSGNLGIGTTSPQGRVHAAGAGGGFMFLSANAVDGTLQTLAAAGTVTQSAAFWGYDRNNTGGAFVQASGNMLGLAQTFAFTNTDTITVSVTAGGAITVQRTAGTNGTHQVNLLVLFK